MGDVIWSDQRFGNLYYTALFRETGNVARASSRPVARMVWFEP